MLNNEERARLTANRRQINAEKLRDTILLDDDLAGLSNNPNDITVVLSSSINGINNNKENQDGNITTRRMTK